MLAVNKKTLLKLALLVGLSLPTVCAAETLVLIQGFMAGGHIWRYAGVTRELVGAGWADGGHLRVVSSKVRAQDVAGQKGSRRFFTITLPSDAPLLLQARYLEHYVRFIRQRHADSPVILAGHSAGGVLGRLYMVRNPDSGVSALITIASPHLGTEGAELALVAEESLRGLLAPFLGEEMLERSQGLFHDLSRESQSNLLGWLNRQPHPRARYTSVVREPREDGVGDLLVPAWSQDMNRVAALRGHAALVKTRGSHALVRSDGRLLVRILNALNQT
ncbi:MAG: alpha/beta fold hydrolase [Gammaproteobacteria bacterium]